MKPEYEKIFDPIEKSFVVKQIKRANRPLLSQAWHFHPEIEICFTKKSNGKRFVGNQISDYREGDLVLLGSNLPHGFTTDDYCDQIVIQLNEDFLGRTFINKPELRSVKSLFSRAKRGLEYKETVKKKATKLISKIVKKNGFNQLIYLLELLKHLADSNDVEEICTKEYAVDFKESELSRTKLVYAHIMENFRKDVSVKEIAEKLNISEASFYKFIKKQTSKTYTQIVNEFRANYASKLLISTDKTIAQICFESGYNNVSYFNRKFKKIMDLTPGEFRKQFSKRQN